MPARAPAGYHGERENNGNQQRRNRRKRHEHEGRCAPWRAQSPNAIDDHGCHGDRQHEHIKCRLRKNRPARRGHAGDRQGSKREEHPNSKEDPYQPGAVVTAGIGCQRERSRGSREHNQQGRLSENAQRTHRAIVLHAGAEIVQAIVDGSLH